MRAALHFSPEHIEEPVHKRLEVDDLVRHRAVAASTMPLHPFQLLLLVQLHVSTMR